MSVASSIQRTVLISLAFHLVGCRLPHGSPRTQTDEDRDGELATGCTVRGKHYELILPAGRLRSSPAWRTRGGENPGVSPGRAVLLARHELEKAFTDGQKWSLDRVWIQRHPASIADLSDRWFYEVAFKPPESAMLPDPPELEDYSIFVLMDGSIVTPNENPGNGTEPMNRRK